MPEEASKNLQLAEAESIDVVRHWRSVINHRWLVLTLTCVALTLSILQQYKLSDYYVASGQILIHKLREGRATAVSRELGEPQTWDSSYYETQVELLRGLPVCERAATKLNLLTHYGVKSNTAAAHILMRKVRPRLVPNTRIIKVTVTDKEPKAAAGITNAVIDAYIEEATRDRMFVSEQILEWFPDTSMLRDSSPAELLEKIDDMEIAKKLPKVLNDPTINKLTNEKMDLEGELEELLIRYTPEHPQVKELTGRLNYIERQIKAEIGKITASLKAALAGELQLTNIKVLQYASAPARPAGPDRKRRIIILTIVGLVFGIALAVFLDSLDKTIRSDEDIIGIPGLPYLGAIPTVSIKKKDLKKTDICEMTEHLNNQTMSDAMNTLNTALLFSMPKGQNKLIMVTSTVPEEGKTTISYLLAASMARIGNRVLLVELDLRRPALSDKVGIKLSECKGISDYLIGQASLEEVTQKDTRVPGLDIILAGGGSPNPITLITSEAFDQFINNSEREYDRIIFDTPPALHMPDPIILSNKMHGVVYIIGAGMIHRKIAIKTLNKFSFVKSTVFGAVINRINYSKSGYASYRHYYSKYYGKGRKHYKK